MSGLRRALVMAEGLWVQRTVTLDPEPPGERRGVAPWGEGTGEALSLASVGDSLIAGCGVADQSEALTPRIARHLAEQCGAPVQWQAHGQLGATMRRVRYRLLPEAAESARGADVLFVCAGSNDVMAGRTGEEWAEDLEAVLDAARGLAGRIVVCSAGQPSRSPAVPHLLREELRHRIDAQTAMSRQICAERGVDYVDVAHADLCEGFWAGDRFHPSAAGYELAARLVAAAMSGEAPVAA